MRTKVFCPNCKRTFIYNFVPSASLHSLRFGGFRYMRCRYCGKFELFDVVTGLKLRAQRKLRLLAITIGISLIVFGVIFTELALVSNETAFYLTAAIFYLVGAPLLFIRVKANFTNEQLARKGI